MDKLIALVAQIALELHPDRVDVVAGRIEKLESAERFDPVKARFGPNMDKELIERFEAAWKNEKDIEPRDVASALKGASAAAVLSDIRGKSELVWTGPSTGQVPIRHTEQVLCEVIDLSKRQLFLVSFVAYYVDSVTKALEKAIRRQVEINVLLESSDEHGGKVSHDSVKAIKNALPSANVYVWASVDKFQHEGSSTGSVHAKCAVADGEIAFITSANLTAAAMDRNMELGVVIRGGELPSTLHRHLEALISTGVVEKTGDPTT
jgi:phosphatidylserine/phosphatidylglycerophosphate/cardiolipin synthase-like enzyme